jgi:hypothetical protein
LTTQTATPLWVQVPTVINYLITAAGIIIAGAWAYVRFARGRILHATCNLGLNVKQLDMPDGARALKITATITNSGGLRLILPLWSDQLITVYRCDSVLWNDAVNHEDKEVLWSEGKFHECNILELEGVRRERILEPGERLRRYILVPVVSNPCAAYRIGMSVRAIPKLMWRTQPERMWETEFVFGEKETDDG